MAVMTDVQRAEVAADWIRRLSRVREPLGALDRDDIRAALNAADQWVSDNQASYNTALPLAFRTEATAAQKARLLALVLARRFEEGVN